jgi:hypothetical protein
MACSIVWESLFLTASILQRNGCTVHWHLPYRWGKSRNTSAEEFNYLQTVIALSNWPPLWAELTDLFALNFHFVEKVCFPHRLNLSRKSQPITWHGRPNNETWKPSWVLHVIIMLQHTKIRQSQCDNKRRQIAHKWRLEFIFVLKFLFNRTLLK